MGENACHHGSSVLVGEKFLFYCRHCTGYFVYILSEVPQQPVALSLFSDLKMQKLSLSKLLKIAQLVSSRKGKTCSV